MQLLSSTNILWNTEIKAKVRKYFYIAITIEYCSFMFAGGVNGLSRVHPMLKRPFKVTEASTILGKLHLWLTGEG